MCILCVFQKWARRVATMLPWLVIPLIGLWILSQFLPPAFRFEITSPRLACVCVLLITLLWYELLMPQLSSWRIRRNARLRERKRFEAIEMQKLRKTATRRCRNCLTPYRDQNPGGGRFMCSFCGHISKRPVLDLPVPPGLSNSGILKDLVGKGGKMLNGKVWSDNSWMCNQDWLDNGNWVGGSISGRSSYWRKNSGGIFGGDEHCFAEKSYSRLIIFIAKGLASFCLGIMWLLRRIFRISSSEDDASMDAEARGLTKRGDNGVNCNESRSEKARRKAEEKRQARLEKEQLEEEERKQREEVARLVEERRKLRDEKAEAEKDRGIRSPREKNGRKEAEKKRQESKKDKDRGSSKSNSDVDELEKRAGMEIDRSKKGDADRREHRTGPDSVKHNNIEIGLGSKSATINNHNRGNVGSRYLDRMRGSILSSSRAFTGGGFFGKGANTTATAPRDNRSTGSIDSIQNSVNRRESSLPERVPAKLNTHADDKTINRPVLIASQSYAAPKKSWQQLFTRSSVLPPSSTNVISRPNAKSQAEVQSPPFSGYPTSTQSYDNPINFGLPSPFTLGTFPYGSAGSNTVFPLPSESKFHQVGEAPRDNLPEESDIFEDPCYVPDPVSLIGPVSESLDNFQLNRGFIVDVGFEKSHVMKTMPPSSEPIRPSPIESPMSRLRASEERHSSYLFPSTPRGKLSMDDPGNANEMGTWHMWNTSPLCQDSFGLGGSSPSWLLPPELNRSNKEGVLNPVPHKTMASLFKNVDQVLSDNHSPQKLVGSCQNGGTYSTSVRATADDPWFPKSLYGPVGENHFTMNTKEGTTQKELVYGNPGGAAKAHPFQMSQGNYWAKKESSSSGGGSGEGTGNTNTMRHPVGGLYSTPDVESLWSYE